MIQENFSLQSFNTFGIDAKARYFFEIKDVIDLHHILGAKDFAKMPKYILGGGSNILFTQDYNGLILKNNLKGIQVAKENEDFIWVNVYGGEEWHSFVEYCLEKNWAGVENLSLIPGLVGAAPIQNIGAYGVEIKDVFEELTAMHIQTGQLRTFSKEDCQFAYRNSIFKQTYKSQYIILRMTLKLHRKPTFKVSYGAIQKVLEEKAYTNLSIQRISEVICDIRRSKLPDPKVLGNTGSFFKNAIIPQAQFDPLLKAYPQMPFYPAHEGYIKVPTGWLIEQCGWKGKRVGDTGAYAKQALVLVNYGQATGQEIFALSQKIQASVKEKFGIEIEREVNVI